MARIYYNVVGNLTLTNTSPEIMDGGVYSGRVVQNVPFREHFKYTINIKIIHDDTFRVPFTFDPVNGFLYFDVRDGEYRLEVNVEPTNDLKVWLMVYTLENNRIDKEDGLNFISIVNGTFKDECDVINPNIVLELESYPSTLNYVYISSLDKFYFVNGINILNKNLYELNLSEDVLMTFQNRIKLQKVFVERNETDYDVTFPDSELTPVNGIDISEIIVPNSVLGHLGTTDQRSQNFLITGLQMRVSGYSGDYEGYEDREEGWLSSFVAGKVNPESDFTGAVALDKTNAEKLVNLFTTGNIFTLANFFFKDARDYVTSFQWFPLAIPIASGTSGGKLRLPGLSNDLPDADEVYGFIPRFKQNGKHLFDLGYWESSNFSKRFNDFRDYEGYTKITIFLPYLGYVDLSCNDFYVQGQCLRFFLEVDFISGAATYYVCASETKDSEYKNCRIILIKSVQIGYQIPIGKTDAINVFRNMTMAISTAGGSLVTSSVPTSTITGTMTKTTGGKVTKYRTNKSGETWKSGEIKKSPTTKKTVTQTKTDSKVRDMTSNMSTLANSILDSAFISAHCDCPNSSNSMFLASQDVIVVVKQPIYNMTRDAEYLKLYGAPLRQVRTISELSGYTLISNVHLDMNCLADEEDLIEENLLGGFIA